MKNIGFICVNYNNSFHTLNWIDSVLKIANKSDFIVIVDCFSNDEDRMNLKKKISIENNRFEKNIEFIESNENVGYFRGLNLGVKALSKYDLDFILVGNNDLLFDVSFRNNLLEIVVGEEVLAIAPRITNLDGLNQNPHVEESFTFFRKIYYELLFLNFIFFKILSYLSLFNKKNKIKLNNKLNISQRNIYMGCGACYILTKNYLKKLKFLPEDFFLMGEEPLLSNQIFSVRGTILYCPTLQVTHIEHASVNKLNSKYKYNLLKYSYIFHKKNSLYINYFRFSFTSIFCNSFNRKKI